MEKEKLVELSDRVLDQLNRGVLDRQDVRDLVEAIKSQLNKEQ